MLPQGYKKNEKVYISIWQSVGSRLPYFYRNQSLYMILYKGKDKNTTQGHLAEPVGSPVTPLGVSSPPSLGRPFFVYYNSRLGIKEELL